MMRLDMRVPLNAPRPACFAASPIVQSYVDIFVNGAIELQDKFNLSGPAYAKVGWARNHVLGVGSVRVGTTTCMPAPCACMQPRPPLPRNHATTMTGHQTG